MQQKEEGAVVRKEQSMIAGHLGPVNIINAVG